MKILLVSTSEQTGGAAIACYRLMNALNKLPDIEARMLVRDKLSNNPNIIGLNLGRWTQLWKFLWERIVIWKANHFKKKNLFNVDIANTGTDITIFSEFKDADIIHLHWINQGMLSLKNLEKIFSSGKPVVWTMHDLWGATGICHYPYECNKYLKVCNNCHFLHHPKEKDIANKTFNKKFNIWNKYNFHLVAVSSWTYNSVRHSTLLEGKPITIIPNVLDISKYCLLDRNKARKILSLKGEKTIAFGAARIDTPIKGFRLFIKSLEFAIEQHWLSNNEVQLILFGHLKDKEILNSIPIPYKYLGYINDENKLSQIYSASNILVSASLFETFGQTLIEAQACGCIPISFNNSGQTDIIDHKVNGFLADYLSIKSLAEGITWGLNTHIIREDLRNNVKLKFSEAAVANKHIQLYKSILC